MADAYTKPEAESLRHAVQDIELFLRLAAVRVEDHPNRLPFKPREGLAVIGWLRGLAVRYGHGEDITDA